MNKLNTFAMHASKVIEIIFLVAACLVVVAIIATSVAAGILNQKVRQGDVDVIAKISEVAENISENGNNDGVDPEDVKYAVRIAGKELRRRDIIRDDNTVNPTFIIVYMVYGLFNCAAFFMIFRNINLILKTAKGKTWFSEGETPFQKDITRMIKEIGIFLISLAVIELAFSFFSTVSVNLVYVFIGILMLCLSSFFGYGEQLQKENDGLI